MQFVNPAFLFALFALVIPVIIHLFSFRRYKTLMFSNVSFLREVKEETASKSRLKHLLILLSRLLALTFLVLAFAQPFIPLEEKQLVTGNKTVSIFLDNSFSMNATEDGVSSFAKAVDYARDVVNAYDVDDKFQLITNDLEGKHQRLISKEEILSLIDEVGISPASRTLGEVFNRQERIFNTSYTEENIAYFISDFQEKMLEFENDTAVRINMIPVTASDVSNIYIDSAWFLTPVQLRGQSQQLVSRIVNNGNEDVEDIRLTLTINGQVKAISDCNIRANNWSADTIGFTINQHGWNEAVLKIEDFPITFDDTYYFNFMVKEQIKVLEISNKADNYLFALFHADDLFDFEKSNTGQLSYSTLDDYQLIILNGLDNIPSGLISALSEYTVSGGNVAFFISANADISSYNDLLNTMNANIIEEKVSGERTISTINISEGLLKDVFEEIPDNISLPKTNFSYDLSSRTFSKEENILGFKNGETALSKYSINNGSLYFFNIPLDKKYSDLAVHAIFVPLMYKIAISSNFSNELAYSLGEKTRISLPKISLLSDDVLKIRNAEFEFIPEQQTLGSRIYLSIRDEIKIAGSYDVVGESGEVIATIALNYSRKESDMQFTSDRELKERFPSGNIRILSDIKTSLGQVIGELDEGISLWKLCIILALVFLAAEVMLIRLMPS